MEVYPFSCFFYVCFVCYSSLEISLRTSSKFDLKDDTNLFPKKRAGELDKSVVWRRISYVQDYSSYSGK